MLISPYGEHSRTDFIAGGFRHNPVALSTARDASGRSKFMTPLAQNIRTVSSADGGIALDLGRGTMFRLNPLGSQILEMLGRGEPIPRIAEQISAECDVRLDVVQTDLREFLDSLELHGVLDPRGPKA
jgi:hypothetical protein